MMKMLGTAILATVLATAAFAEGMTHRVAIHVDENDPQVMEVTFQMSSRVMS